MRKRNGSIYPAHLTQQTHPLTSDRARGSPSTCATADAIDKQVVPVLADPDQQRLMALRGKNMTRRAR